MIPPILPTWVLERFRGGSDSLIGDLVEEYECGRSNWWYWTQALGAVMIGLWTEVRLHKGSAVRATLTGWAVLFLFSLLLWSLSFDLVGGLLPLRWHVYLWIHPPGLQALLTVLGCIAYASSGWVVARLHSRHRAAMLLVFVLSLVVWRFPGFGTLIVSHHRPNYFHVVLISSIVLLINSGSILLGGFLGSRKSGRPPEDRQVQAVHDSRDNVRKAAEDSEGALSLHEGIEKVHLRRLRC